MIEEHIINIARQHIGALQSISENGVKSHYSFELNCGDIRDYNHVDICDSERFKEVFSELVKLVGPVVYWFEIKSKISNEIIRQSVIDYSLTDSSKATPAIRKNYDSSSRCLYLGKVKRNVWGRIIQHLGYYKVKRTQGLQLFYWAKELKLDLNVHLYEFEESMNDLVSIFETELAKLLKPIVGKHK